MAADDRPLRVLVIASYMRDLSVRVAQFARPGETCVGSDALESHGGKGSNQAIQAARCGAQVTILASIGDDAAGRAAMAQWARDGIDTRHVAAQADRPTGLALIVVDGRGENQIVIAPGSNACVNADQVDLAAADIRAADIVLAQLETPPEATQRAFGIARAAGVTTMLNTAPAPDSLPPALLALTDILIANEGEAATLAGVQADADANPRATGAGDGDGEADAAAFAAAEAAARVLLSRVGVAVLVTLGPRGALLLRHGAPPLTLPAHAIDVVDTTGAGDAFVGAFASQWSADAPQRALAWGTVAGALACTGRGVVPALATRVQIEARLR